MNPAPLGPLGAQKGLYFGLGTRSVGRVLSESSPRAELFLSPGRKYVQTQEAHRADRQIDIPASCLPQQYWSLGQLSRVRQWSGVEEECLGGAPGGSSVVFFKHKRVDGLWSLHVESPSRSLAHDGT